MAPTPSIESASSVVDSLPGDTDQKASVWSALQSVLKVVSYCTMGLFAGYGLSDLIFRLRQNAVDRKANEQKEESIRKRIRHKAWTRIAQIDPQSFLDKIVLKRATGKDRQEALAVLYVANPEWVKDNVDVLKKVEYAEE